jgi:hypothetical protein
VPDEVIVMRLRADEKGAIRFKAGMDRPADFAVRTRGSDNPELAQAARKTLESRLKHGGGQTGWSRAWVVNYYRDDVIPHQVPEIS